MRTREAIPASTAGVYTNGAAAGQQKRALRRLVRDLVAFTGTAISDLAVTPRQHKRQQRLLYRRADALSNAEVKRIVLEIGCDRILHAVDEITQPSLPLVAAE